MTHTHHAGRREFLKRSALASGSLLVAGFAGAARGQPAQPQGKDQKAPAADDVTPVEDLMREHGALRRILLIYEEAIKRIDARVDLPPEPLVSAADLVRRFVEDYHEKLEENHLFPRFEKAAKLVELVVVLQAQHQAGRRLTDQIRQLIVTDDPPSMARTLARGNPLDCLAQQANIQALRAAGTQVLTDCAGG